MKSNLMMVFFQLMNKTILKIGQEFISNIVTAQGIKGPKRTLYFIKELNFISEVIMGLSENLIVWKSITNYSHKPPMLL